MRNNSVSSSSFSSSTSFTTNVSSSFLESGYSFILIGIAILLVDVVFLFYWKSVVKSRPDDMMARLFLNRQYVGIVFAFVIMLIGAVLVIYQHKSGSD